jgi:hypothetical protein
VEGKAGVRAIIVSFLFFSTAAEARKVDAKFLLDVGPGIAVPIAGPDWRADTSASFKHTLRLGGEFWITSRFGLAVEADADVSAVMIRGDGADARFRGLVGMRELIGFGVGAFFFRQAVGFDHLWGANQKVWEGATSPALEFGIGVQFKFARRGVAGFTTEFPVAFYSLIAVDVQIMGFVGARI